MFRSMSPKCRASTGRGETKKARAGIGAQIEAVAGFEMSIYHSARRIVGHSYRELSLYPRMIGERGPRIMFFPSSVREGASHLRAYNVAEALRERGWHTLTVPRQLGLGARRRLIRRYDPDLLFFQQCRHELNDVAFAEGRPYVLDIDDADFYDPKFHDRIARTAAGARGVIAGSRFISDWCLAHNANTNVVWTGTPVSVEERPDHDERPPIVAWAQRAPLRYPRELDFVRSFYFALKATGRDFTLRLYGANSEDERRAIHNAFGAGEAVVLYPRFEYDDFLRSLRSVSIGLSPIMSEAEFSRGKSFGKILGYLDAKVPVIASDEADHAQFFTPESGVVTNDPAEWVRRAGQLLDDPRMRNAMAETAFHLFESRLTREAATDRVDAFLRGIVGRPERPSAPSTRLARPRAPECGKPEAGAPRAGMIGRLRAAGRSMRFDPGRALSREWM